MFSVTPVGVGCRILYSNKETPPAPGAVRAVRNVTVHEVDGTLGHGPLRLVRVTLQPMEVQRLGRPQT